MTQKERSYRGHENPILNSFIGIRRVNHCFEFMTTSTRAFGTPETQEMMKELNIDYDNFLTVVNKLPDLIELTKYRKPLPLNSDGVYAGGAITYGFHYIYKNNTYLLGYDYDTKEIFISCDKLGQEIAITSLSDFYNYMMFM